ncbi:MAG: class I SAM-dependent methyltransferase [Gaiellaceae bacterium]
MPAQEDNTASHAAGRALDSIDTEPIDIAALYARLRQEIRRTGAVERNGDERHGARSAVRGFAERYWAVTAERPLEARPGWKGKLSRPVKRLLRPFLRWYVEPLAYEQRMFNDAALKLIDALYEEVDRVDRVDSELDRRLELGDQELGSRLEDLAQRLGQRLDETRYGLSERIDGELASLVEARRLLDEVEERLTRTERRGDGGAPRTIAPQPAATAFPDYFAFESKLRGQTGSVRERQRIYVDDFRDAAPVLDVGCGRGELLALLRDEGIEARGVDADADMVVFARGEGLDVEQADAVSYLESLDDGSLGGIFMGQVVEHLPPGMLVRTLELSAQKLRDGGLLIAETINPLSPLALRNYFADLTHAQPLVPETLALLARQVGFTSVETRFLNPPEHEGDVAPAVADILFAPLDYAIVARR